MLTRTEWSVAGADGESIRGVTESPAVGEPSVVVTLAHGFTTHRGFGFLPALGRSLVADCRAAVVRFTFSHAGVTGARGGRIDRPDLFERDTWGKQIVDLGAVLDAIRSGAIAGAPAGRPVVIAGHSRGGGVCLLFAGRRFAAGQTPTPDGVVSIASPDRPGSLSDADCVELVRSGSMPVAAPMTGQRLRIGREFGQERLDNPAAFDVLGLCGSIGCPVLAVGGERDRVVPPVCARRIADACPHGEAVMIEGADHMFNTPEPAVVGVPPAAQVEALGKAMAGFVEQVGS